MRTSAFSALALGFGLVTFQLSACSNSADDCNATASCGATSGVSGSAGTAGKAGSDAGASDGGGDTGGAPATGGSVSGSGGSGAASGTSGAGGEAGGGNGACTGDIASDTACWATNELGVFVSSDSNGSDSTGDGTMEKPFATITAGLQAAAGKNVYVCQADNKDYLEQIILNKPAYDVHIYGGFECKTWTYSTTRSALVTPATENVALRIISASNAVYIENLRFTAADASGTGLDASSYGAFVTDSKNVTLKRVVLTAGKGAQGTTGSKGANGSDGPMVPAAPTAAQKGKPASCDTPPASQVGGSWGQPTNYGTQGGDGGLGRTDAALSGGNGLPGTPASNVVMPGHDNSGPGASTLGAKGMRGGDGSDGLPGALGAQAAAEGSFDSSGFTAANGANGNKGYPGQGGGGGGGSKGNGACVGASGGAGGMGGEGGGFGGGGIGGGASVGLLVWNSTVLLTEATVASSDGGKGGDGGPGGLRGQGAPGAPGGLGVGAIGQGGPGGDGANGGDGGSGSGGTGGPSIAIVYHGAKPVYNLGDTPDTTLSHAAKAAKGGAGGVVLTAKAPDGFDGAVLDELMVK